MGFLTALGFPVVPDVKERKAHESLLFNLQYGAGLNCLPRATSFLTDAPLSLLPNNQSRLFGIPVVPHADFTLGSSLSDAITTLVLDVWKKYTSSSELVPTGNVVTTAPIRPAAIMTRGYSTQFWPTKASVTPALRSHNCARVVEAKIASCLKAAMDMSVPVAASRNPRSGDKVTDEPAGCSKRNSQTEHAGPASNLVNNSFPPDKFRYTPGSK